jgi:SAM-dependent methyltransferase
MKCPICKFEKDFKQIVSICEFPVWHCKNKLLRHQCPNCDVIFGPEEILNESKELLKKRYQILYNSGWKETDSTESELDIIKKLNLKNGQRCLNWGGGSVTNTVYKAKELGIILDCYEPFDPYAKNAITNLDGTERYDAIISNNLMEHLQDPVSELILMSKHLQDDGVMIHKTPCWEYVYEWTEYHLFFFLGKSPEIMAQQAGLMAERLTDNCIRFTKIK